MCRFLLSLGLFILLCAPALAGTLFPPKNSFSVTDPITGVSTVSCAANTSLVWSTEDGGCLKCMSTSEMVTIPNCPAGKVFSGITNGVPVCTDMSKVTIPNCPEGQVLKGISNGVATCVSMTALSSCVSVASNGGGWAPAATASCPGGYTLTGGSCNMYRGGDGREISPRTCSPSGNGYYCAEGNSGNCVAIATCCK